MNKNRFLEEVREQLQLIFLGISTGQKPSLRDKSRLEGFMRAGAVLGATTNRELRDLMESVHMKVFGESIDERKAHRRIQLPNDDIDYEKYERPAIERVKPSR